MFRPYLLPVLFLLQIPAHSATEGDFLERFALAADRTAILRELVPGTDDYYYYHALHYQVQGQMKELTATLTEWEAKILGKNARREIIKNRKLMLDYSTDPAGTLTALKEKLQLRFDHQRDTEEARAELPSTLDETLITDEAFRKLALEGTEALEKISDAGLYSPGAVPRQWKLTELRALLSRLKRPDYPNLVGAIDSELKEKGGKFGTFPIHTMLTAEQLAALQKLHPELINDTAFTSAVLDRMRPLDTEDPDRDIMVRAAWLERLWAYASTLNPNANPLKANLLYHLLALDEKLGRLDEQRLLAYLKLPRVVHWINPRIRDDRELWKYPAQLDYDPSAFTGTAPIGDDEPLLRRLVMRYLLKAENTAALEPLVSDVWLRGVLAETKLVSGAPEAQRWVSLLPPDTYRALRDRIDIDFDPAAKENWLPDDKVTLDVWLKNVPSLFVRIYEINTANVHRVTGEQVNTGLNLDGLTANVERKFEYKEAPILRRKQTFSFPELNAKRGVWVIEFVGGGKASRALIRKGGLRTLVRQTALGTALTVLDEGLRPVPKAFAMVGPKRFTADENGLIALPLSTNPGEQKIIIDDGNGFTSLETVSLQGEAFTLDAGFHVPRESLLPGAKAIVAVKPVLLSNDRPVPLDMLEETKLTITSNTLDGNPATAVFPLGKLDADKEASVEFSVPDRLSSLSMMLTGKAKSTVTGLPVEVMAKDSLKVNGITASGIVNDLHLSREAGVWKLQELGLNGEARAGREVKVNFWRNEFLVPVEILMKTDAAGIVTLGKLEGIESMVATNADGITRTFFLSGGNTNFPDVVQLKAGERFVIPWQKDTPPSGPAEVSLLERRGNSFVRQVPLPAKPVGGYLVWRELAPGTYTLFLHNEEEVVVRVSGGDVANGHVLTPASAIQLTDNRPLSVVTMQEAQVPLPDNKGNAPALVFHVGNASADTRVHVFASRFQPKFDASDSLGTIHVNPPSAARSPWLPSVYLSSRNIGDEYRYVLERRGAVRFAGNLLPRPGILINPWQISETQTDKEELEVAEKAKSVATGKPGEAFGSPAMKEREKGQGQPAPEEAAESPSFDLSFLAAPGAVLLNVKPDAQGNVVIPRAVLGDRSWIRVLAVGSESSATRDFSLAAPPAAPRDLRLVRGLEPSQHFSQQNRVSLLEKDVPLKFNDALAAQFQAYNHLGSVHQLFASLSGNPLLAEFSWLLEWPKLDDTRRRELYSKYACHELHFFLARKDPAFFKAVVLPYLADKRDKTFMDEYLLSMDVSRHLQPWHYQRLNTLEKLLLAERIAADRPAARRYAEDWVNIQPVNRRRDLFLFETALRGKVLTRGVRFGNDPIRKGDIKTGERDSDGTDADDFVQMARNSPEGEINSFYSKLTSEGKGLVDMDRSELAAELATANPDVKNHFGLALGYHDLGQFKEAEEEFNKILSLDPANTAARRGLERSQRAATNYLKSGRDETRLRMLAGVDNLWMAEVPQDLSFNAPAGLDDYQTNARLGFDVRRGDRSTIVAGGTTSLHSSVDYGFPINDSIGGVTNISGNEIPNIAAQNLVTDLTLLERQRHAFQKSERLFRQLEKSREWAEQNYYNLRIAEQTAALVTLNRFWRDYARWDGKSPFVSTNVTDAAGTFTEMILALAVLDLPFPSDAKPGKMETKDDVLTLTPSGRGVLFHQEVRPAELDNTGAKLLVSQNFYREGDRYVEQGGEKIDKFVSAEFLTGVVYGCQAVVTNPSSSTQRLDVLFQVPMGALPVKTTRRVQSLPVQIEPYRTQTLDFHFYFPEPGKFAHFPVHISRDAKTAASAAPFVFNVVAKSQAGDPASWDYVSQSGSSNEVLSFLEQHNLYFLNLDRMLWRMKDADFFRRAIAHLKSRHVFHAPTWSYAVLHNAAPYLTEYLMATNVPALCGPVLESPLLTVEPVEQKTWQLLEYSPLVNARAHRLGSTRTILNDKFRAQWSAYMQILACRKSLSSEDLLAVSTYLTAQDRLEEALEFFGKVDRAAVAEKLQYEYLRAWLAMCQEDTATARRIAKALAAYPVDHWRKKFATLTAQLDEIDGKPGAEADESDRDAKQDALADSEPSINLTVQDKIVKMKYRHLSEVTVNYYPVDLEFLFSSSPFVSQDASRFSNIRPARSERIMLPLDRDEQIIALPGEFQNANVLVEVSGAGQSKAAAVYANALDVQVSEGFGQLTVSRAADKRPLSKVYVKVFSDQNGTPAFYKDGYTDLRGKFDYASLSTGDLDRTRRFSILVMSEDLGAVVKEVKPPAR
ncbi:MAG TPA: tetratricopeptide repeat protein [Verrucomicrobiales bacterium]|nr:tetratricopeptide repeat protein [Verrucomicrobiales bacterium]